LVVAEIDKWANWNRHNEGVNQLPNQANMKTYARKNANKAKKEIKKFLILYGPRPDSDTIERVTKTCKDNGIRLIIGCHLS
jgi:hypothetical protein